MTYIVNLQPKKQKYTKGSIVRIANDLGPCMYLFTKDTFAIVEGTYASLYGGHDVDSYALIVKNKNGIWSEISWYYENQINLVDDIYLCKEIEMDFKENYYNKSLAIPSNMLYTNLGGTYD